MPGYSVEMWEKSLLDYEYPFGPVWKGLFREGKFREIARYCAYDVKVTMRVHEFGRRCGYVKYRDNTGQEQRLPVQW